MAVKNILYNSHKYKIEEGVVGDVKHSMLSEAQFQAIHGSTWVLMRGQDITGTELSNMLGITRLPDQRGKFLRSACLVANRTISAVNATTNALTVGPHEYSTGFKVQLTGTLPAPLVVSTTYFVIVSSSTAILLASSYANAIAGTAIDITGTTTGGTIVQWEDPDSRTSHEAASVGSLQENANQSHNHFVVNSGGSSSATVTSSTAVTKNSVGGLGNNDYYLGNTSSSADVGLSSSTGGNESRPVNRIYNTFVKVD